MVRGSKKSFFIKKLEPGFFSRSVL
jgi:hypothetical protein